MGTNIKDNGAIYSIPAPTVRMAHLSPNHNGSPRGSYEIYDSQRGNYSSSKEELRTGTPGISAPGSPCTMSEFENQTVLELKKELERRSKREEELKEVISSLKSSQAHTSNSLMDNQFMNLDAGTGSEDVGENVKDAHLKHLQRQVTVLQANLYKAEGWANRAASATQERDKALDEVSALKADLKHLEEENQALHHQNEELLSQRQELQQNLVQLRTQQESRIQSASAMASLQEEAQKYKMEIKTLKESLSRLENENKHLKESTTNGNNQAMGNIACSRELEYLHQVVNTLKNTVLEQRNYLLGMRNPSGHPKSLTMSPSYLVNGSLNRELASSSTRLSGWGSNEGEGMNGPSDVFGQPIKGLGMMGQGVKDNLLDSRLLPQRNGSAPELGIEAQSRRSPVGRRLSSREVAGEAAGGDSFGMKKMAILPSQPEVSDSLSGRQWQPNRPTPHMVQQEGYINQPVNNLSTSTLLQQQQLNLLTGAVTTGDMTLPKPVPSTSMAVTCGLAQMQPRQHKPLERKTALSEVLGRRFVAPEVSGLDQNYSKSETIGRNPELMQGSRKSPQWRIGGDVQTVNNTVNMAVKDSSSVINQQDRLTVGRRPSYERNGLLLEPQDLELMWDRPVPNLRDKIPSNLVTSAAQPMPIYHPPVSYTEDGNTVSYEESNAVVNPGMMAGGRMTAPPPVAHQSGISSAQGNLYMNIQKDAARGGSSVDGDPRSRTNSDRVCPVCNKEYSHVSMEDFQTHVFECFDDESAPETMKPQDSVDRTCPMCNAKFPCNMPQSDFEKHVHSHFGEDGPPEPFEILS